MELRHLRYFVAVAEEMHFGRAARRLNISQPPLSIQIRHLEEELGVELFIRKKDVKITPAGREFLAHARAVLSRVEQGKRSAQRAQRGEVGELAVGFMSAMAYTYLPWQLRRFRKECPGVELTLYEQDTHTQLSALRQGRINVGIVRGPVRGQGLVSQKMLTETLIVALPPGHRCAAATEVSMADLADEEFITFPRRVGGSLNDEVMRLCDRAGFVPKIAQEAIQLHVVVSLVSAGIGIAIVPESTKLFQVSGVTFRPLAENDIQLATEIIYREDELLPTARKFVDIACSVAAAGLTGLERLRAGIPAIAPHVPGRLDAVSPEE